MAATANRPRPITSDFVYDLPTVASPAISPDGSRVAYASARIDRETMESESHIAVVPFGGGPARRLTAGPRDRRPHWSPDGASIAFLRSASGEDGTAPPPQSWLLPLDGGEARQLNDLPAGVFSMTWTPDGAALICVGEVDPDAPGEDDDPSVPRVKHVNRIYYRADGLGWRGDMHRQLFRVDATSGATQQLTRGDHDANVPVVSPDGSSIAFWSSDRSAARFRRIPGRFELCVIAIEGGRVERIVRNASGAGPIAWSPDGRRIAYVSGGEGDCFAQSYLHVVERFGGEAARITNDSLTPLLGALPLADPPPLRWAGRRIVFAANAEGSTGLYSATPSGSTVERLRGERELVTECSVTPNGSRAALLATTLERPSEVIGVDLAGGRSRRLSDASDGYLREHSVASTERFSFRRGGLEIECWLTFPPGFDASRRYPLVLEIHGGPNGFFGNGWYPGHQILASAGNLVLWTNPRGSASYGHDFVSRVYEDWGGEDYEDLMAAVDRVIRRPYVDASRLGVHGYSYGGFMTSWTVGHTNRFRAAVVAAPVTNLVSMYGQTDISTVFGERQWGGPWWQNFEHYVEHSPLRYAPNVETPVLLLHGEADIRCPIQQSEEYYTALKRLGKTVEFVRFPGGYHGFVSSGHPAMRTAYYDRVVEWFDRWLH